MNPSVTGSVVNIETF